MSLSNTLNPAPTRAPNSSEAGNAEAGPFFKPTYEVSETPEAYGLVVNLPGVAKDGLELTAENGQVTLLGRRAWQQPEGWVPLYRETANASFRLVLTHDNAIDADKVTAELNDGVLRVSLPKSEALKPRKIAVN